MIRRPRRSNINNSGSGGYDQWLSFYKMPAIETFDSFGSSISEPELQFETWGAFDPLGGFEFPESEKRNASALARFRIPKPDYLITPATHTILMVFDPYLSPPDVSTWNVLSVWPSNGNQWEVTIEVDQVL